MTQCQSIKLRTPHLQRRQPPEDNNFPKKIASIQTASWLDSHEKGSETKAPYNHHLLSFTCQINYASPAVEMAAPSEAAAMRCSFMSWQRNLFFYLPPRISMSHLSIAPIIPRQRGTGPALTLIRLFDVLMTLWPPIDPGHTFNCTWCKDASLAVTDRERYTDSTCPSPVDLSSTWADWSLDPAFLQSGHMCLQGSLECPYSHVRCRKSLNRRRRKQRGEVRSNSISAQHNNTVSGYPTFNTIMNWDHLNSFWMIQYNAAVKPCY